MLRSAAGAASAGQEPNDAAPPNSVDEPQPVAHDDNMIKLLTITIAAFGLSACSLTTPGPGVIPALNVGGSSTVDEPCGPTAVDPFGDLCGPRPCEPTQVDPHATRCLPPVAPELCGPPVCPEP